MTMIILMFKSNVEHILITTCNEIIICYNNRLLIVVYTTLAMSSYCMDGMITSGGLEVKKKRPCFKCSMATAAA